MIESVPRRRIVTLLFAACVARAPFGTAAAVPRRIVLIHEFEINDGHRRAHARWLAQDGLIMGSDVVIEYVNLVAIRDVAEMERKARAIVASRPDVILIDTDHTFLFKRLTSDIPIVFANFCCDLVRLGLVESLQRPGGNVTGTASPPIDKALEVAKELRPRMKRIGMLFDDNVPAQFLSETREGNRPVARRLGLVLVDIAIRRDAAFPDVERAIRAARVDAVEIDLSERFSWEPDLMRFLERARIIGLWGDAVAVRAGGLLAVHSDGGRGFRDAMGIAARILKGAKPAEMPVQINHYIHTSINLRTAKAMGIEIPPSVLTIADVVFR